MADSFVLRFQVYASSPSISSFLSARLASLHQAQLPQLFEQNLVSVDGQIASAEQALAVAQQVEISLPEHYEEPVDIQWRKLWENDEILAVYKPHLLPVSRTTRNLYNTLISLVRRQTPYEEAHLLHRLDTETAGIILLAKTKAADKKWKPQLDKLINKKIYQAWVAGTPKWDELSFACELSEKIGSSIRSQMYVVDPAESKLYSKPKQSKTLFRVLCREQDKSLIECELITGRKHQIRVHLAHLGHPIIGDKIYSKAGRYYLKRLQGPLEQADFKALGSEYQMLTAVRMEINPDDQPVIIRV